MDVAWLRWFVVGIQVVRIKLVMEEITCGPMKYSRISVRRTTQGCMIPSGIISSDLTNLAARTFRERELKWNRNECRALGSFPDLWLLDRRLILHPREHQLNPFYVQFAQSFLGSRRPRPAKTQQRTSHAVTIPICIVRPTLFAT